MTCVPVRLYFKNGRVKVEIALAKGKNGRAHTGPDYHGKGFRHLLFRNRQVYCGYEWSNNHGKVFEFDEKNQGEVVYIY